MEVTGPRYFVVLRLCVVAEFGQRDTGKGVKNRVSQNREDGFSIIQLEACISGYIDHGLRGDRVQKTCYNSLMLKGSSSQLTVEIWETEDNRVYGSVN
jgi:hypothetical protein